MQFPHAYTSTITRTSASHATVDAPPRAPIAGGPPPEFKGDATDWSPEHLLASALGLCLFATFEAFAARDKLSVVCWRDTVTGMLDRTPEGLAFTSFVVDVELTVDEVDLERAKVVLDRAAGACIVTKSVRAPVTIVPHIWSHDERARSACKEPPAQPLRAIG